MVLGRWWLVGYFCTIRSRKTCNQMCQKLIYNAIGTVRIIFFIGFIGLITAFISVKTKNGPMISHQKIVLSVKAYNHTTDGPGRYVAVSSPCCILGEIVAYGADCYPWGQATCVENPCPYPSCWCNAPCDDD